ncbi:hypothetical protein PLESTB_000208300 [Pleodorina starrii]|uniref:Uncharacterized protein n=1 Tax=Pleodorina starrii TaxID=330485 RepID=A0A9W6BC04_9CHLO|nr:hypothetical protein PLESTB_000208300 [Pleodorina starrii]GLC73405.1 hypothetical protein PLESTF_001371800 [Pleodorina starrii]
MADISRTEMGLIIGLVLGTLFLALVVVLSYVIHDKRRSDRRAARRLPAAGPRRTAPGETWTTINNTMVGLELYESTPSPSRRGADAASAQPNLPDPAAPGGGAGSRKSFLTALLAWTRLPAHSCSNDTFQLPGGGGAAAASDGDVAAAAVAAAVTSAAAAEPAAPGVAAVQSASLVSPSFASSEEASSMVGLPEAKAGLAVVMVQLGDADGGCGGRKAAGTELPLSGCLGAAVVSLVLAPPPSIDSLTDSDAVASISGSCGSASDESLSLSSDWMHSTRTTPSGRAPSPPPRRGGGGGSGSDSCRAAKEAKGKEAKRALEIVSCVVDLGVATDRARKAARTTSQAAGAGAAVKVTTRGEGLLGVPAVVCRPVGPTEV